MSTLKVKPSTKEILFPARFQKREKESDGILKFQGFKTFIPHPAFTLTRFRTGGSMGSMASQISHFYTICC
jgi:hypothetical protein